MSRVRTLLRTVTAGALAASLLAGCWARKVEAPKPQTTASVGMIPRDPGLPPVGTSPQPIFGKKGVTRMQKALRSRGFKAPVDGEFGFETQRALLAFQKRQGLAPTGMPDLETTKRLGLDPKVLYGPH